MRDIKMTDIIYRSFVRTSNILFDHFSLKIWLKLAVIAFFAGSLFSFNLNYHSRGQAQHPFSGSKSISSTQKVGSVRGSSATSKISKASVPTSSSDKRTGFVQKSWKERLASIPKIAWYIAPVILIIFVFFVLLFAWINSRFRFIWFHAIATRDVTIVEPFHRHRPQGNSLFRASLLFSLAGLVLILGLAGDLIYFTYRAGAFTPGFIWSGAFVFRLIIGPLICFVLFALLSIFISVMINHFVVPVMALDKISFLPAFKKVWGIFEANKKDVVLFYLLMFLLSIASSAISLTLAILCLIVVAVAGFLIFGLGYLLLVVAIKAMPLFIAYGIIFGVPFLAVTYLLFVFISLPFAVFFRSYSIEYLCAINCGYSYENLESYEKDRSEECSKAFIWAPILIAFLFMTMFVGGLLAAIAIPNFIKTRNAAKYSKYVNRADADYIQGNLPQAIVDYSKAIEMIPRDARLYYARGLVYGKENNLAQASADYAKAIEIDPKIAPAYFNLGIISDAQGKIPQAIAYYDNVIELNPKDAWAYNDRGIDFAKQGELSKAILDYNKAIEIDPRSAHAYNNRGVAYEAQNKLDQAFADFQKAINIDPEYKDALKNLEILYENRGFNYYHQANYAQAIPEYAKAIEINSKKADYYFNRGLCYAKQKEYEQAWTDIHKAQELGFTAVDPVYINMIRKFASRQMSRGNKTDSIDKIISSDVRAIELNPDDALLYIRRGRAYAKEGNFERAIADFNKAIEVNPKSSNAYNARGMIYERQKEFDKAIEDINKAIEIDPQYAGYYSNRARIYFGEREYDKSWSDVRKAQELGYSGDSNFIKRLKEESGKSH